MGHANEELGRQLYSAFSRADAARILELLADDIVWHNTGRNPLAGDSHGKEQVLGHLSRVVELTEGTFRVEVEDVLANDQYIVVLARGFGRRSGKTLDGAKYVAVYRARDGKICEAWFHWEDLQCWDDFLS